VYKALLGQRLTSAEFIDLDDVSVTHCFKLWAHGESDATLAGLCRGLLFREVYKTIDLSHLDSAEATGRVAAAERAIDAAGGEAAYDVFFDEPGDSPYEASYEPEQCPEGKGIFVVSDSGETAELSGKSPLPAALHRRLAFRRLHVRGVWVEAARRAVGG
jgi:hypothetical protein